MLVYYETWQDNAPHNIDRIGINDDAVTEHLRAEILHDKHAVALSVRIKNFSYENGYFMLWQLSVADDRNAEKIIPIFISEKGIYRPAAGKKIMDVFLNGLSSISVRQDAVISEAEYDKLEELSKNAAYNTFVEMKDALLAKRQENYNKRLFAIQLREEAAAHVGIDNIRNARIARLQKERNALEDEFVATNRIYPEFRLMCLVKLETI